MLKKQDKKIRVIASVLLENEKGEFLFLKSKNFDGAWWLPAGHVPYGKNLKQGALDELKEETALIPQGDLSYRGNIEVIEPKDYYERKHFVVFYYHATIIGKQEIKLDEEELSDYKWMTIDEVKKEKKISSLLQGILDDMDKNESCTSCEEYKTGWQRAQADYKNLQQEVSKQRGEWARMSEQQILEEFIPVYDNFKKAFNNEQPSTNDEQDNWKKGIEYIMKQFGKILEDHGILEMRTVGELFNPELHEAVGEEESDEDEGRILREVEGGYKMRDKVIKVAKVIVSK